VRVRRPFATDAFAGVSVESPRMLPLRVDDQRDRSPENSSSKR
jgi:hypothetical protein